MGVIPGAGPACENNFTMSFFVAPTKAATPEPSSKDVFLSAMPTHRVYVRSFGGRANEAKYLEEAEKLEKALKADDISDYVKDYFYTAGYDSPFKIFNRHNEVWFM